MSDKGEDDVCQQTESFSNKKNHNTHKKTLETLITFSEKQLYRFFFSRFFLSLNFFYFQYCKDEIVFSYRVSHRSSTFSLIGQYEEESIIYII